MKHFFAEFVKTEGEVIACWGEAKVIKTLDGKYELVGGTTRVSAEGRRTVLVPARGSVPGDR